MINWNLHQTIEINNYWKEIFCHASSLSASISVGYETLRMRSQDSAQCPSKTIMHYYTYICLHVGCSFIFYFYKYSYRYWSRFLSKFLIIFETHLIRYSVIVYILLWLYCFYGTPVRFWEGKIWICAGIVEKKETWIFSGNRSELMNLLLYGALLTKCTMLYSLCLSLMWMIYHPQS